MKWIHGSPPASSRVIAEESCSRNVEKGLDGSWNQIQDSDFKIQSSLWSIIAATQSHVMDPEIFPLAGVYYLCEEVWSIAPPPAMPVWSKSEQTGVGPCYEISQSSDSIICLKNINVKWQFYRPIFSSYPFYNCGSQQCQVPLLYSQVQRGYALGDSQEYSKGFDKRLKIDKTQNSRWKMTHAKLPDTIEHLS